jgi:cellulose synthase/poly-beta-1,6-N-acetylglucosamine synthase-like glycosyltransferase
MFAETVFLSAALVLIYTYAGYPLLIWLLARLRSVPQQRRRILPAVSIVVIAHNEELRIRSRIENLLALNYPRELLEIVIASDASTDSTAALARGFGAQGVKVIEFARHRGKPAVLNDVLPRLTSAVVVLMDVRQRAHPDAVQLLVDNFADPAVGAVSGELILLEDGPGGVAADGVGFYWRYEKFIRQQESRLDSTVGATGALYALRPELFEAIPEDTILDDVLIPMQIARKGYRVLFDGNACIFDRVSATPENEFRRKVRTIAGNYLLLCRHPWLLNPLANRLWFQTVSHKFLRLLGPVCLLAVLGANLLLLEAPLYRLFLALQILFYLAASAGHLLRNSRRKHVLLTVPHAFCLLNWSTAVGFYRFIRGNQRVTWA